MQKLDIQAIEIIAYRKFGTDQSTSRPTNQPRDRPSLLPFFLILQLLIRLYKILTTVRNYFLFHYTKKCRLLVFHCRHSVIYTYCITRNFRKVKERVVHIYFYKIKTKTLVITNDTKNNI